MGTNTFPYMVDPNSRTSMSESDNIINYLFETYGDGAKVSACFYATVVPSSVQFSVAGRLIEKATDVGERRER